MPALFLALVLNAGAGATAPAAQGAVRMKASEIAAYNANLTRDHPNYILCVNSEKTGSLVKKKVCRTNQEWARLAEAGNRDARETAETMNKGWSHSFEPDLEEGAE